jgi:hypothetical protein
VANKLKRGLHVSFTFTLLPNTRDLLFLSGCDSYFRKSVIFLSLWELYRRYL